MRTIIELTRPRSGHTALHLAIIEVHDEKVEKLVELINIKLIDYESKIRTSF